MRGERRFVDEPRGVDDDLDEGEGGGDGDLRARADVLGPRTRGRRRAALLTEYARHSTKKKKFYCSIDRYLFSFIYFSIDGVDKIEKILILIIMLIQFHLLLFG